MKITLLLNLASILKNSQGPCTSSESVLFVQGEYLIIALIRLSSHLSSNTLKISSGLSLKHHKATQLRAAKSQDGERAQHDTMGP